MTAFKAPPKLRPLLADPDQPFIHRDLSWLQFNQRVLAEADEASNPLLERVKFLSISASNLDEFFQIRFASLGRSIAAELRKGNEAQLHRLRRIRAVILNNVLRMVAHQNATLLKIAEALAPHGIHIVFNPDVTGITHELGKKAFDEQVLPELEAPSPYAPNQLNLLDNLQHAIVFSSGSWLRVSRKLSSVILVREPGTDNVFIFFLAHLLARYAGAALGLEGTPVVFRLTRDADVSVELDDEDTETIPDVMLSQLRKRERGRPVRLQYFGKLSREELNSAQKVLKITPQQLFNAPVTLGMHRLWSVLNRIPTDVAVKPEMSYPPIVGLLPKQFENPVEMWELLKQRDFLLHHPYDSFASYVHWIRAACEDPNTTMIQQTVYRMDALSPVIDALKSAATRKKVRVVIELRARFDELNNLRLAEDLRKAGVEVTFGFGKLKLHAKVALVTRIEDGQMRLYTHLSTGNYNAVTARAYTDLAILTSNQDIGQDAQHFFESVWKNEVPSTFRRLVPAPTKLHRRIMQLIDLEMAAALEKKPARIIAKVNTLVDESIVQHLYKASQTGVKIDLIVRGACSLVPGVKGMSENIRVISIVDRFLEHSRIYYFESSKVMYISSADWMPRNFFSRLELAYPVLDDSMYAYLEQIVLPTYLNDTVKAKELASDGTWKPRPHSPELTPIRAQFRFAELAKEHYNGTPLV